MTKHVYQSGDWTGVALVAQYDGHNIRELLENSDPAFMRTGYLQKRFAEESSAYQRNQLYCDVPIEVTLFYNFRKKPGNTIVGALEKEGKLNESNLSDFLDELLAELEIKEVDSTPNDAEPLWGVWTIKQESEDPTLRILHENVYRHLLHGRQHTDN